MILATVLLSAFAVLQTEHSIQEKVDLLSKNPSVAGLSWSIEEDPSYAPFVFLVALSGSEEKTAAFDAAREFGNPISVLLRDWKSDWARPLKLETPNLQIPIALVPNFERYRALASSQLQGALLIPPYYFDKTLGMTVSYRIPAELESKLARRRALLSAVAERWIETHCSSYPQCSFRAWVYLGLATDLAEIQEKQGGPRGRYFEHGELKDWKEQLPRLANAVQDANISIPSFPELISLSTSDVLQKKAIYRDYVGLCGYSLILFFRSEGQEELNKRFQEYLKEEFQGRGGWSVFQSKFGTHTAQIENQWLKFCERKIEAPKQAPTTPTPNDPKTTPAPAPNDVPPLAPSLRLPRPIPLSLQLESPLDLRAEMMHLLQARKFERALQLVDDPRLNSLQALKKTCAEEKAILESAQEIYRMFGKQFSAGQTFPSGFGLEGNFVAIRENDFDLREKYATNLHRWNELELASVANYLFFTSKKNDPATAELVANALLLAGKMPAAKLVIQKASDQGMDPQVANKLLQKFPDYEHAASEMEVRAEIERIASLDPFYALDPIRKLAAQKKQSPSFVRAVPFFRGQLAKVFEKKFETKELPTLLKQMPKLAANESWIENRKVEWVLKELETLLDN